LCLRVFDETDIRVKVHENGFNGTDSGQIGVRGVFAMRNGVVAVAPSFDFRPGWRALAIHAVDQCARDLDQLPV
jgi:hypothetical protein